MNYVSGTKLPQEIPDKLGSHMMLRIMQIWEVDGIFRWIVIYPVQSVNMFNVWKIGARSSQNNHATLR